MSMTEMYIWLAIGIVITAFLLILGIKFKKKWLKIVAILPLLISSLPLIYLVFEFGPLH